MFRVYLMQHGEAVEKEVNPDRPLTENGRLTTRRMGMFLRDNHIPILEIWHSPKTRARETAQVIAECVNSSIPMKELEELEPDVPPKKICKILSEGEVDNILIVGHLPHLSRLVSLLVVGDADKEIVQFEKSGIVCIESEEIGTGIIRWMLIPSLWLG